MKRYVTFAMAAILMFGMTLSAQTQVCQGGQRPATRKEMKQPERKMISPEKRAEMMAEQLQLTDVEKAKVQALFEKQQAKAKQRQEEMKNNREEQRAKIDAERKAFDAKLIKIIGNEKFQQHQALRIKRLENANRKMRTRSDNRDNRDNRPYNRQQHQESIDGAED
ncbi:MAG: hypothetical protein PHD30_05210 [Paludibacter sp.]|nr:hypothetical protein [Paludibacter sp.]